MHESEDVDHEACIWKSKYIYSPEFTYRHSQLKRVIADTFCLQLVQKL